MQLKALDMFPKVLPNYQNKTKSGVTLTLFTFGLIQALVLSEFVFFLASTEVELEYVVDTDMESKLAIHFDIMFAMPCDLIGADILDVAQGRMSGRGVWNATETPVRFDLSPKQRAWFDEVHTYVRRADVAAASACEERATPRGCDAPRGCAGAKRSGARVWICPCWRGPPAA